MLASGHAMKARQVAATYHCSAATTLAITSIGSNINDLFLVKVSNALKDANK